MSGKPGRSGRRPLPIAIHIARGTYRPSRHGPRAVTVPAGTVPKPAALSEPAGRVWDELAPICLAMGTLTPSDVHAFVVLCELLATFRQAATTKTTSAVTMRAERAAAAAVKPWLELFGLAGPLSRRHLPPVVSPDADDAYFGAPVKSRWADLLK
jgi:Phage terminase, small subunit